MMMFEDPLPLPPLERMFVNRDWSAVSTFISSYTSSSPHEDETDKKLCNSGHCDTIEMTKCTTTIEQERGGEFHGMARLPTQHDSLPSWLPIHWASFFGAPLYVVKALLDAYPDGAATPDRVGWLPLHMACFNGAGVDVVSALIDAYPQAARTSCLGGYLPLHLAFRSDHMSKEVIFKLLDAYPDGGRVPDSNQRTWCTMSLYERSEEGILTAAGLAARRSASGSSTRRSWRRRRHL